MSSQNNWAEGQAMDWGEDTQEGEAQTMCSQDKVVLSKHWTLVIYMLTSAGKRAQMLTIYFEPSKTSNGDRLMVELRREEEQIRSHLFPCGFSDNPYIICFNFIF